MFQAAVASEKMFLIYHISPASSCKLEQTRFAHLVENQRGNCAIPADPPRRSGTSIAPLRPQLLEKRDAGTGEFCCELAEVTCCPHHISWLVVGGTAYKHTQARWGVGGSAGTDEETYSRSGKKGKKKKESRGAIASCELPEFSGSSMVPVLDGLCQFSQSLASTIRSRD